MFQRLVIPDKENKLFETFAQEKILFSGKDKARAKVSINTNLFVWHTHYLLAQT